MIIIYFPTFIFHMPVVSTFLSAVIPKMVSMHMHNQFSTLNDECCYS